MRAGSAFHADVFINELFSVVRRYLHIERMQRDYGLRIIALLNRNAVAVLTVFGLFICYASAVARPPCIDAFIIVRCHTRNFLRACVRMTNAAAVWI